MGFDVPDIHQFSDEALVTILLHAKPGMCYINIEGTKLYVLVLGTVVCVSGDWKNKSDKEINEYLETLSREHIPGNPNLSVTKMEEKNNEFTDWYYGSDPRKSWGDIPMGRPDPL